MGGYYDYKHCFIWSGMPHEDLKLNCDDMKILFKKHKSWMLLPTHYYTKGLPCSIVDAYIAGIPVIATE